MTQPLKYRAVVTDNIARLMNPADRHTLGILLPDERLAKTECRIEKRLQRDCENWLTLHGYRRRTPEEIRRPGPCVGWFIHLHETRKNPILLDLLILRGGSYKEIELKSVNGKLSPEQESLITRGGKLCRTLEEFIEAVD